MEPARMLVDQPQPLAKCPKPQPRSRSRSRGLRGCASVINPKASRVGSRQFPLPSSLSGDEKLNFVPTATPRKRRLGSYNNESQAYKISRARRDQLVVAHVRSIMLNQERLRLMEEQKLSQIAPLDRTETSKLSPRPRPLLREFSNLNLDDGSPNWAATPAPALAIIFQKLGPVELLATAQYVCFFWHQVALDLAAPFRPCVDVRTLPRYTINTSNLEKLAKSSVDRTTGPLEELHVMGVTDDFLIHVSPRVYGLRRLSLIHCYKLSHKVVCNLFRLCPGLEELNIVVCPFLHEMYHDISKACPHLKILSVNGIYDKNIDVGDSDSDYRGLKRSRKQGGIYNSDDSDNSYDDSDSDDDRDPLSHSSNTLSMGDRLAVQIASNVHLRELQIWRDLTLTNKGVHVILDRCVQLESLDLRRCYDVRVDANLHAKLVKIKTVKLSGQSVRKFSELLGEKLYA